MESKERLVYINKLAAKYYIESLYASESAKKYLFNRIDSSTAKTFCIGYAPNNNGLIKYFNINNIKTNDAYDVGLIGLNNDKTAYEIFTKRIMFPIINNSNILGFTGRTLIDHPTKYLNSKNTILFNKRKTLYLLDLAKKSIYEKGYVILVEGQFDVLSLFSNGIRNVVAVSGSSLGEDQALLIRRWTNLVYICFDGDDAGIKASERVKKAVASAGLNYKVIKLPHGYDPADFVTKFGVDKFKNLDKLT